MKRVFFCVEHDFPRGDAGSNRVLHLAKAVALIGWTPIVIATGKSREMDYDISTGCFSYEGVRYYNLPVYGKGKISSAIKKINNARNTIKILKNLKLDSKDAVIVYSGMYIYCKPVSNYSHNTCHAKTIFDVVEWHQPFQFNHGKHNYRYKEYNRCFTKVFPSTGHVIAISDLLMNHFKSLNCKVLKLPVYITPDDNCAKGSSDGILRLIYPGNPYGKDSLSVMLKAIDLLSDEEKRRVCLNLTGAKKTLLYKCVSSEKELLDKLIMSGNVKIYEWMEYDELLKLYDSMDFALIARPDNIVTQANFPSKVPELLNKGIPPIMTPVGDISDYLKDGENVIFFEKCDAYHCLEAIRKCMSMSKERISSMHFNAKVCAKEKFDYRISCTAFADYLNE